MNKWRFTPAPVRLLLQRLMPSKMIHWGEDTTHTIEAAPGIKIRFVPSLHSVG